MRKGQKIVWHDDDSFWLALEPFVFSESRWTSVNQEVDAILALTRLRPGARIIDVGCGPGRHSLELCRRGYEVTGVDRTSAFIEAAKAKAADEGLRLELITNDMREFIRPLTYDCGLSMYTSFGYFEDQDQNIQVLSNIYDSLKYGGVLILELMGKEILARVFSDRTWDKQGDAFLLQERKVCRDWSWIENRWTSITSGHILEYETGHWIYSAQELNQLLLICNFVDIEFFGNLSGDDYDTMAQRLVVMARKDQRK
jgi:SAM-dependent methyltransferase